MYFDIIFRRVDFPLPFLPTITFTPGLNINSEPFLNAFIFWIYLNGVFLLSSILIEVIILYDFVLNYLNLSSIAKSNILSRHLLISSAYSNRSSFERSLRCQSYIFVYRDSIALFSISSSTFLIDLSFFLAHFYLLLSHI